MRPRPFHLLVATLGCSSGDLGDRPPRVAEGSASPPAVIAATAITAAPSGTARFEHLLPRVEQFAIQTPTIGRRILVSWTTREQADAIAAGGPFLSRVESPLLGPSGFDWMLDVNVAKGDKLARFVFQRHYARKRFAWPNAYATAFGRGGGRYGTVLLRVDLREDALVIDFPRRRVLTVDNQEIAFSELEARPERLAAIFWDEGEFREYVLVNESAIARVSSGTPETLDMFRRERELLDALADAPQLSPEDELLLTLAFARTLAFSKEASVPQIRAMAREIRTMAREAIDGFPDGLEFSFAPAGPFVASGPRPRLANPGCKLKAIKDISDIHSYCAPKTRCRYVGEKC